MHLSTELLIRYLEAELHPSNEKQLLHHLKECDSCRKRLKESYTILQGIDSYVEKNRENCPSSETMEAYTVGKLSKVETIAVKKHLSECPYCVAFQELYDATAKESQDKK
jgi:anti-sigma factor ChrR (cupin superfamily)